MDKFMLSPLEVLEKHFITKQMRDSYEQREIDYLDNFVDKRNKHLQNKEREFVETLEMIKYTVDSD